MIQNNYPKVCIKLNISQKSGNKNNVSIQQNLLINMFSSKRYMMYHHLMSYIHFLHHMTSVYVDYIMAMNLKNVISKIGSIDLKDNEMRHETPSSPCHATQY